jgi:hypothetical protein
MESTEELWITFQANPHMSQRVVESGKYSYLVDLVKMTQTNVSHPAQSLQYSPRLQRSGDTENSHSRLLSLGDFKPPT